MKEPQLSDVIFNKKKNCQYSTMWNKLYTKITYLAAISFLGEKRYKEDCLTDTVGFRKVCPTLAMPYNYMSDPNLTKHNCGNFNIYAPLFLDKNFAHRPLPSENH